MKQLYGSSELIEDVFEHDLCVGCGMCVDLCPYFKNYLGKTSQVFACDLERGRCYAYCPKTEVDLGQLAAAYWDRPYEGLPLGPYRKIAIARAGEKAPRGRFQGGGTVTALITHALTTKHIDAAVLTGRDGAVGVPMVVTDPDEVSKAAGSKFTASPTLAALNGAIRDGYTNIGVVGTPCQITAVAQMRQNPLELEDFNDPVGLTVGLFCTWALDTRKLLPVVDACVGDACVLAMDVPPPPAEIMVVDTDEKQAQIPLSKIRPLVPHGCQLCPDMTSEWADVSVGQVEGMPGWNTLIIRTERGERAVHQAIESGYLDVRDLPKENLQALEKAGAGKKSRALEALTQEGGLNAEGATGRLTLRMPPEAIANITAAMRA